MGQGGSSEKSSSKSKQVGLSDFEILDELGQGSFGKVWRVREKTGKQRVLAMKRLSKRRIVDEDLVKHTLTERNIMSSLGGHSFVVSLEYAFETPAALYFVMEYLGGGSLFHHLRNRSQPFDADGVRFYAAEILVALQALHQRGFIYRDLKLENILLDADGHCRISDFGLSRQCARGRRRVHSFSGSNVYIAPEILSDQGEGHGYSVDWWGFGVLLHLLCTQQAPFWRETNDELFALIREGPPPQFDQFDFLDEDLKDLLSKLLERNPQARLGCKDSGPDGNTDEEGTLEDEQKNLDELKKSQEELRNHIFFKGVDWDAVAAKTLTPPFVPKSDMLPSSDGAKSDEAPSVKRDQSENANVDASVFEGFYFCLADQQQAAKEESNAPDDMDEKEVTLQGDDSKDISKPSAAADDKEPAAAADATASAAPEMTELELLNSASDLKERGVMVVRADDESRGKMIFSLTSLEPSVEYVTLEGTSLTRVGSSVDIDGIVVDIDPEELAAEKALSVVTHKAILPNKEDQEEAQAENEKKEEAATEAKAEPVEEKEEKPSAAEDTTTANEEVVATEEVAESQEKEKVAESQENEEAQVSASEEQAESSEVAENDDVEVPSEDQDAVDDQAEEDATNPDKKDAPFDLGNDDGDDDDMEAVALDTEPTNADEAQAPAAVEIEDQVDSSSFDPFPSPVVPVANSDTEDQDASKPVEEESLETEIVPAEATGSSGEVDVSEEVNAEVVEEEEKAADDPASDDDDDDVEGDQDNAPQDDDQGPSMENEEEF